MKQDFQSKFPKEMVAGSIVARFEQQVNLYKDKVAVKSQDQSLTYLELNTAANRVARTILRSQVEQNETVAMLFDHNVSAVVAILGILKAGKAYIPLDPTFPVQRLKYMVEDSRASLVLTNQKTINVAQSLYPDEKKIINIDDIDKTLPGENPGLTIPTKVLAFILYSSGSTGKPKGIIQDHRNVLHHIWDHTTLYDFGNNENHGLVLSFSFAASVSEIFSPLLNGGTLCLYDIKVGGLQNLAAWLTSEGISVIKIPISLARIFISTLSGSENFPKLRLVILGGDTLYRRDVLNFRERFSSECVLVNRLTSTETNSVTQYLIEPGMDIEDRIVPVGYPAQDKEIMILDDEGQDLGFNEIGEIVIKSRYVTPGYWNQPELTKDKFQTADNDKDMVVFHTGDLGRLRPDGCLEHLGRTDFMVKVRGYRVEMAEITAALLDIDSVEDAVVTAPPDSSGEKRLVAYVVIKNPSENSIKSLRSCLTDELPDYMIPEEFIVLDTLPKTPTGKIDYQNLPDVESFREILGKNHIPPKNPLEKELVEIWEQVLEQPAIGIRDDFFELGGNSLDALRTVAAVETKFGYQLTLRAFIQARTIEKLAESLVDKNSSEFTYLVTVEPGGDRTPFFCVPPSATTVMKFGKLAQHMGGERPFYGLEYAGMDGKTSPHFSITLMAEAYLKEIKKVQPSGPYLLGGMCFGGLVAYEMAQQLLAGGEKVAFLGILDSTHAPNLSNPKGYYIFLITRFINQNFLRGRFTFGASRTRISGDDEFRNQVQYVFSSHNFARMKYRTDQYPGKVTLFNTAGRMGEFSRTQWKKVVKTEVEVVMVPGKHIGHTFGINESGDAFIQEPHVRVLAEKINFCLNDVDKS
jgi:amino acid adenylation domain-containing protein